MPREKNNEQLTEPILTQCLFCRLCFFIFVLSCVASVYFVVICPCNSPPRMPPLVSHMYTRLEEVQPEERDVFQDFRTSFLPSDELAQDVAVQSSRSKRYINGDNESFSKIWLALTESKHTPERTKRTSHVLASAKQDSQHNEMSPEIESSESEGGSAGEDKDDSRLEEDMYYDDYESDDDLVSSVSKEAGGIRHPEDRGPLDDVVEQVRAQPELEEGELGTAPLQYHSPHRYTGIHAFWKGQGDKETIRQTQASIMRQYMDADADPCEDFFQYACGNWPALNPIPPDKAGYDTFEMLRENLDTVLRDLLEFQPRDLYNSEYPGPNLDVYDNFLTHFYRQNTKSDESATIVVLLDHNKSNRNRLNTDLLHRIRRYLDKKKDIPVPKKTTTFKETPYSRKKRMKNKIIDKLVDKDEFKNKRIGRQLQFHRKKKMKESPSESINRDKYEDPASGDATLKARFLFKSCMNYDILQKRGHQPLLDLLDLLGGWPVLKPNWDESKFDWLELMANLRLYNNDILISEWVGPDIKNSDEFVIQFDQTSLGLPTRDYFLQDSNKAYLEAYKDYLIKICLLMGGERERVHKSASELIKFETRLASITSAPEERRNVSELYRRMSLRRLESVVPGVQWRRYLCIVMNRTVHSEETIVLFALKYVQSLVRLVNETNPSTLSNYLLWRFVRHRVNNLDDRFQQAKQQFYNVLFGREQAPPRWKNCISQVNSNMGMALGSMFVGKYFDEISKNDTLTMTREIQKSFRELLALTDWIDSGTKKLAAYKVDAMMLRIGYPDFILRKNELDDRYKEVVIHPDKYFENILNILQHLTKMEQARLGQPVNKTLWNTAPAVVNAYYSRNKNQIMFPAGILQPPFYHRHFPKSLNYGGIGVVIGHEITHGFDDKGRLFDCDGNLHRWWSDSAIEAFHRRAQCLIDQYGRYIVPEVNVKLDGINTQGENIADNGGVKQAFRAYKRWLTQQGEAAVQSETMPGLNHTHKQLFFLNFAQVWCGSMRPEAMRNKLKTAVHSPGRFRVIGALSNSEDFAREFSCKPGSPMNPTTKCNVW